MVFNRRFFIKGSAAMAGVLALRQNIHSGDKPLAHPALDPKALKQFVDPLPIPSIARPLGTKLGPGHSSSQVPYYRLAMREFQSQVHRDLKPARLWGFGGTSPGPTFETRSGEGLLVEWANELPHSHFLPIDHS